MGTQHFTLQLKLFRWHTHHSERAPNPTSLAGPPPASSVFHKLYEDCKIVTSALCVRVCKNKTNPSEANKLTNRPCDSVATAMGRTAFKSRTQQNKIKPADSHPCARLDGSSAFRLRRRITPLFLLTRRSDILRAPYCASRTTPPLGQASFLCAHAHTRPHVPIPDASQHSSNPNLSIQLTVAHDVLACARCEEKERQRYQHHSPVQPPPPHFHERLARLASRAEPPDCS